MARKPCYTTEQLRSFVDAFVEYKHDWRAIKIQEIVDFCNETLCCTPPVSYHMFSRNNPEIRAYIKKLNDKMDKIVIGNTGKKTPAIFPDKLIDVDKALRVGTTQLEEILRDANKRITSLSDLYKGLVEEYKKVKQELQAKDSEAGVKDQQIKDLELAVKEQKRRAITAEKKQVSENVKFKMAVSFIKEHVSVPIWLGHLKELGYLSEDEDITLPERAEDLMMGASDSVDDVIERYEKETGCDVYSGKITDFISKIQGL